MNNRPKIAVLLSTALSFTLLLAFVCGCEKKKAAKPKAGTQTTEPKSVVKPETKAKTEQKKTDVNDKSKTQAAEPAKKTDANNQQAPTKTEKKPEELSIVAKAILPAEGMSYELKKVIDDTGYWSIVAKELYGQTIPDFTITDIEGKAHKLSDYRGKNVLVFSWAVWCPGCKTQIYFLNRLRKEYSEDKLAILAIAVKTERDNIEMLKEFAAKNEMNYPIFYMDTNAVPMPFNLNMFVPCSYFVNPQGGLKVGLEEIITFKDLKKILETP
jgi:thiol-disulfide isomerase/thioredoxin